MRPRVVVYGPHSFFLYALLAGLVSLVVGYLFLNVVGTAFTKLGFSWDDALLLFVASLLGSRVNLPLARIRSRVRIVTEGYVRAFGLVYRVPQLTIGEQSTLVALNVGGAVIPLCVSFYLLARFSGALPAAALATAAVTLLARRIARPVEGVGIVMPALAAPLAAGIATLVVATVLQADAQSRFVTAYVSGTLGTLLGADVLNLPRIGTLGAPVASIGGAGTFDGVFLSGILAVILV